MRKCINGHIGFGKIRKCKRCGEILLANKNWRKGRIERYATRFASKAYKIYLEKGVYVLKVVMREQNPQAYIYAKKEIQMLLALIDCEYVVRLINSKIENDAVYILEDYCESVSQKIKSGALSKNSIANLGMDICRALMECREKRIYHLDIQPQNLYIDTQGRYKLGGFDAALYKEQLKSNVDLSGALDYMAPEVYYHQQYSEQAQIYSLGLVLYYLYSGSMPFSNDTEVGDAVHRRLSGEAFPSIEDDDWMNFINKACAYNKEERFATFEECLEALKKYLENLN